MNRIEALPRPTAPADRPEAPAAPDAASSDVLYLPVMRLWMLRALVRCNGARNFVGDRRLREPAVAEMLELKGLSPSRYSESAAMRALQRKLDEVERLGPTFPETTTLARNIQRLAQRLALNPIERDILHFACAQHMQTQLCEVLVMVGDLTRSSLCQLVADCLGHPVRAVQRALDDRGRLSRSALLTVDDERGYTFDRKIDLLPGLAESLLLEHDDLLDLFAQAVVKAPSPTLALADFEHLADDLRILRSYLDSAGAKGQPGVNVLLHGRPGTGKTELARAVAAELGLKLMEVPTEEPGGKPRAGRERFESYRFAQSLLDGSLGHAVLAATPPTMQ
jgi:transitional endoplasmic reticulum ATPase